MLSIYTDGSAMNQHHPQVGGIGFVAIDDTLPGFRQEFSAHIGQVSCSQMVELRAIEAALKFARMRPAVIYTDSHFCVENLEERITTKKRSLIRRIDGIKEIIRVRRSFGAWTKIEHVVGHNGDKNNERANQLARKARKRQ